MAGPHPRTSPSGGMLGGRIIGAKIRAADARQVVGELGSQWRIWAGLR
jgi:hypothetical protein